MLRASAIVAMILLVALTVTAPSVTADGEAPRRPPAAEVRVITDDSGKSRPSPGRTDELAVEAADRADQRDRLLLLFMLLGIDKGRSSPGVTQR
jgi:hypothetical protein